MSCRSRRLQRHDSGADGGSDTLIDTLLAHGDAAAVAARLNEHLDAGADHVTIQMLTEPGADPLPALSELSRELRLS